jgi:hypothetical protein
MMDGYSRSRGGGVAGDLAFLLSLYLAATGGLAYGLYEILQPTRFTNPGLAAYKPPPATSVISGSASKPINPQSAELAEPLVIFTTPTTELDTAGRSLPKAPITETLVPVQQPPKTTKAVKAFNRQITREPTANQQRVACLPRYDSSGAQTGAC